MDQQYFDIWCQSNKFLLCTNLLSLFIHARDKPFPSRIFSDFFLLLFSHNFMSFFAIFLYFFYGCDGEAFASSFSDGFWIVGYFTLTPRFSRNSSISVVPCIKRLTPRGKPRHDDKFMEFNWEQLLRISLTASSETDDPHKFKWLKIKIKKKNKASPLFLLADECHETYVNGDSWPFSANARMALSSGVCTLAQAKSHSIKLCAHFDAMSSKPDLKRKWCN